MSKFKTEVIKLLVVIGLMSLMFMLFGGLSIVVVNTGWDYVKILSGTVMACGLYTVVSSLKPAPAAGGRRFLYNTPGIFFGTALMSGAALYAVFKNAFWFLFCLVFPLMIGAVLAARKSKKSKV